MTFVNIELGRVLRAVLITTVVGIILSFGTCYCFLFSELLPTIDTEEDISAQQDQIQTDAENLLQDIYDRPPSTLNVMFLVQLGLVVLLAAWQTHWAAQRADSPQLAMGYAVAVTGGILFSYGILLLLFAPILFFVKALFFLVSAGMNVWAAQIAWKKVMSQPQPTPAFGAGPAGPVMGTDLGPQAGPYMPGQPAGAPGPGIKPDTYYQMGVSAALGGRREEARQHFTHLLQMQPRHIAAWLQLANLADTPEQAWNYVQQARSINPTDPAVMQAVNVIWPQVAAQAENQPKTPHLQPPYKGATPDDVEIPRTTLPRPSEDMGEVEDTNDGDPSEPGTPAV